MSAAHPAIARGVWEGAAIVGIAIVVALAVRSILNHAGALTEERVDATLATRFRVMQRLIVATIVIVGFAIGTSRVAELDRLATSLLASSAIAAATVGLAARQVLGNALAGIQLAVAQPVRIGDTISIGDHAGTVEDVRLTSTYLRTARNARVIIPNEQMVGTVVCNESILAPAMDTEASIWLPPTADAAVAVAVLSGLELAAKPARVAEIAQEGAVRVVAVGEAVTPAARVTAESALRAQGLAALRAAGVLPTS